MTDSREPLPDEIELADDNEAYAEGDRTLDDLTAEELDGLKRLPAEMDAVSDVDSALGFYDRLAGHDG